MATAARKWAMPSSRPCRGRATLCCAVALLPARVLAGPRLFSNVASKYAPLRHDAELFEPSRLAEWLHPEFAEAVAAIRNAETSADAAVLARSFAHEESNGIYSFPLLTAAACNRLLAEVDAFAESGLPARRPNSMNMYGLVLNEIGLKPSLSALQEAVHVLARELWPTEGATFDDHHSFVVSYKPDEDRGLDMHTDDSDVTLNVCLGKEFDAAGLTFCGEMGAPAHRKQSFRYKHVRGQALLHLGRQRHGADDIAAGHRVNLIMWNWNRAYRQSPAYIRRSFAREASAPDAQCVSFTHDRDYEEIAGKLRPPVGGKPSRFGETAWCPPPHAEYDGFVGTAGRYRDLLEPKGEQPLN